MMGKKSTSTRYTEEFKLAAVKQVCEEGHTGYEVAQRLGMAADTLYRWVRKYGKPAEQRAEDASLSAENRRLREELKRVTEERDILKKAAAYFARGSR
jgi:transposase